MIRLKTYDATGVAPNGRLFAGDLNALQDAVAALTDLTQNLSVATIAIGESGLQLVRYGAGEARITGAARVDGILRGLSGLYAGQYTTTQRDAIPLGARPTGLIIYNTTTGRPEFNAGTDASPSWQPVGAAASTSGPLASIPPAGSVLTGGFYYATDQDVLYRSTGAAWVRVGSQPGDIVLTMNTVAGTGRLLGQGQNVSRTGLNADLFAKWSTTFGAGDGSTTFGLPDLRGRMFVMLGTHADVATIGNKDAQAVADRRPKHKTSSTLAVGLSGAPALTGAVSNGTLAATHNLTLPNHVHHEITEADGPVDGGPWMPARNDAVNFGYDTGFSTGNPTSLPAIPGSVTLTGGISNGTLAVGVGTLAAALTGGIGTGVANDNADAPSYITVNGEIKL